MSDGYEREWRLGEDLYGDDPLLQEITFDDIILQVHCNCRQITASAVRKELRDLIAQMLEDMRALLDINMDVIIAKAKEGRED